MRLPGALLAACLAACGPPQERSAFFSFEGSLQGWVPQALDLRIGDQQEAWSITSDPTAPFDGASSARFFLENVNGAGKIWLERTFTLPSSGRRRAHIDFAALGSSDAVTPDSLITGVAVDNAGAPPGSPSHDNNGILILTATGTFRGAQKRIQVVMRRHLPPGLSFPAAVNEPGVQSDTYVVCTAVEGPCANFEIDGRDYSCSACTPDADAAWYKTANWSAASGPALKLGIATQPGDQQDLSPATTYKQNVENAFKSVCPGCTSAQALQKEGAITGKDQATPDPPATATGLDAIGATNALNPTTMQNLLKTLTSNPKTQVLQSTLACPMQINGDVGGPTSTPTLTNGCGMNQTIDLGTPTNPQLVYFRGDLDPTSNFAGLTINNQIQGAGILIVEDGDIKVLGNLNWQGLVIVTGQYVGAGFMDGSTTNINGALVSNETVWNEQPGFSELHLGTMLGSATFHYSQQALDLMNRIRKIHTLYGWRTVSN